MMTNKDLLLLNLPRNITEQEVKDLCSIKKVNVRNVRLIRALDGQSVAGALITVLLPSQVKTLKDGLYNHWIIDKKLRTRTMDELTYETFNERTLMVRNLPKDYKQSDVLDIFDRFGVVMRIEMPFKDSEIEELLKHKQDQDPFTIKMQENIQKQLNRTKRIIKDSIETEEEYQAYLESHLGQEETQNLLSHFSDIKLSNDREKQLEVLDTKRKMSLQTLLSQLQAESFDVKYSKEHLQQLLNKLNEIPNLKTSNESQSLLPQNENEKEILVKTLKYISQNRENVDEEDLSSLSEKVDLKNIHGSDPIQQLQTLSREHLAESYDSLINILRQRETLIQERIESQIKHLGNEERILFDSRDFSREFETIKPFDDVFLDGRSPEDAMTVNEQIQQVLMHKNFPIKDRLEMIMEGIYNYHRKANWDKAAMDFASTPQLSKYRMFPEVEEGTTQTMARMFFTGAPLNPVMQKEIDEILKDRLEKFDVPFDELYHKEKKVVDQVVKAYEQLRAKERLLPDPMGPARRIQPGDISEEILEAKGFSLKTNFERDQKRENDKLLRQGLDSTESGNHLGYLTENQDMLLKLVEEGVVSRDDYEKYKSAKLVSTQVNLGYAFVTYSFVVITFYYSMLTQDEAKIASVISSNMFIENQLIEISPKGSLEHKDLDQKYVLNQMKNDSKLSTEYERLRQAKLELRQFEKNLDKDMPKLKQIERFKEVARDLIENDKKHSRIRVGRNSNEEELVNDQIRQLQKENPDIDFTQLFDTERAELLRKNQHKKAFTSYKAYQFLKHGVDMANKIKQEAKVPPRKQNDPHEFPPIQDTLARFLTKDKYIDMIDRGESSEKPGRKFNYTEKDFFEAYFGKDYARRQTINIDKETQLFGYNRTLKETYPAEKYYRMPLFEKKQKEFFEQFGYDPEDKYSEKYQIMQSAKENYTQDLEDYYHEEHPTEDDRIMLGDIGQKMESALKNPKRQASYPDYKIMTDGDLKMIRKQVREDYFPEMFAQAIKSGQRAAEAGKVLEDTKKEEKFEPHYQGEKSIKTKQHPPALDEVLDKGEQLLYEKQEREESEEQEAYTYVQREATSADFDLVGDEVEGAMNIGPDQYVYDNVLERQYGDLLNKDSSQKIREIGGNKEILRLNRNVVYELKDAHKQNGGNLNIENDFELQRIQKIAEDKGMTLPQYLESIQSGDLLMNQLKDFSTDYYQNERLGITSNDFDVKSRQHKSSKNLQSFARESDSEREDEDIYKHYVNKMNEEKQRRLQENKEKLNKEEVTFDNKQKELLETMFPDIPRFEGYFNSMSKGQHPFEDDKYKVKDDFEEEERIREAEVEHDEELYSRELTGRLLGEKLTPRQFSILFNAEGQEKVNMLLNSGAERAMYLDNRKKAEIVRELVEQYKRQMIHQGEWTEQNAEENLQKFIEKNWEASQKKESTETRYEIAEKLGMMKQYMTPKQLLEKEYYFDEGLGMSVNEHVQNIKEKFPEVEVSVRRDRDGFALIKTLYRPQYKYDLDKLLTFDAEKEHSKVKESAEVILKSILPFGVDAVKNPTKLSKEQLQQSIKTLMPYQSNENSELHAPDAQTLRKIEKLVNERMNGKYANDNEGFAKAFLELSETATFDQSKKLAQINRINPSLSREDANRLFRENDDEQELFQREITAQVLERVREYILLKERKPTDFITNKRSEHKLFSEQVHRYDSSADYLEDQANQMDTDQPNFDKEAYRQLKAEIKKRREAKERLLQQGFPELKPYLTF